MSHPAWVCGLKLVSAEASGKKIESHPAWVCGLKRSTPPLSYIRSLVTPCVGVWIETMIASSNTGKAASHPAWVCGLKQNLDRNGLPY